MVDTPDDVKEEYNLHQKATKDGFVYEEVRNGIYRLPQVGLLVHELLEERLGTKGYHQSSNTSGLWVHEWRPIQFTLVVDDFGVKHVGD